MIIKPIKYNLTIVIKFTFESYTLSCRLIEVNTQIMKPLSQENPNKLIIERIFA